MTTKEIAQAVGKTERGVRNWVSKLAEKNAVIAEKLSSSSPMKPADYNLDETIEIIRAGMGNNAADIYRTNAEKAKPSLLTERDLEIISKLTTSIITGVMQNLDNRVQSLEAKVERRAALLPAPQVSARDAIRQAVNQEAARSNRKHADVWRELYDRCYYLHMGNLPLQARNRGMKTIDLIEETGQSEAVLAVATDLWNREE